MELHKGQKLKHYQIQAKLGQGSFAYVYRAKDLHLDRIVAIKVLKGVVDIKGRESFLQEAKILANLRNKNIVQVHTFDFHENVPFLVMDFAPNGSLNFPEGSQQPLNKVVSYVQQAANALDYAHSKKLIHRDVKPQNMLLGNKSEVLLSDFGLVKLVRDSSIQLNSKIVGTPRYMAPEQINGKECFASDLYALGIVVYEWLTGYVPFRGNTPIAVMQQHLQNEPPSLHSFNKHLPISLDRVILKALSKDPAHRFVNVKEFAEEVTRASQVITFFPSEPQHNTDKEASLSTLLRPHLQSPIVSDVIEPKEGFLLPREKTQNVFQKSGHESYQLSSHKLTHPQTPLHQQDSNVDFSTIPISEQNSSAQLSQERQQDYLRWLILGFAVASVLLLPSGFILQQPQIWVMGIVITAVSILLGLLQTLQRDQWFWFIGFLCFSPLTGLFYGSLNPNQKANPPASIRQLILVTGSVGLLLFISGLIISSYSSLNFMSTILIISGVDLALNHWLLGLIRVKRLNENIETYLICFMFLGVLWAGLAYVWNDDRDP